MRDMLVILDFDHVAARAIARKLRAERICCKIFPASATKEDLLEQEPLGLVLAGGETPVDDVAVGADILALDFPVLALSATAVWMAKQLGSDVGQTLLTNELKTVRFAVIPLFEGLEQSDRMLLSLNEMRLGEGLEPIANVAQSGEIVGYMQAGKNRFGVQLDIEQHDTDGAQMLKNFAMNICGCTPWWDEDAFVLRSVQEIKRVVGEGNAMCAMTGGLNSGVSALLAARALGRRLKCVFVDTGLLRDAEGDTFMAFYQTQMGLDIKRVYAQERFLEALKGVEDAREKRRIIGALLSEILEKEQQALPDITAIIKGTSFADVMGSVKKTPNLDRPIEIEPVRDLFKDEIRQVGEYLGLPSDIISRQPFPGSGLALRIMGEVTPERLKTLRMADAIFRHEVIAAGQTKRLWQFFAVLSPFPGNEGAVLCLRAVHATDGAMAYAARLPYDVLENTVSRVLNECPMIRRVVYDMTPSTHYTGIEWQ